MKENIDAILDTVRHEVQALYEVVRDYESDTFSASDSKLADDEVLDIVARLINTELRALSNTDTLDGVMITEELNALREEAI